MRTSDERVKELHERMTALKKERDHRTYRILSAAAVAVCLAFAVGLAVLISKVSVRLPDTEMEGAAASIFAENEALGIIVAAILAFTLGVMVTVFCFRLRMHQDEEHPKEEPQEEQQLKEQ